MNDESSVEKRLRELGLSLPDPAPTFEFLRALAVGDLVFVSGHVPYRDGEFRYRGKVGRDFDLEAGRKAAELALLGSLASLKSVIGSLDRVRRVVKLNGYVNCTPEFTDLPKVMDAASRLAIEIFGDDGRHARTTVGVASLPLGAAAEIEMTVQLK
jgi:enamine deaminase RidA (YjgF/YER057c/UK114 family)